MVPEGVQGPHARRIRPDCPRRQRGSAPSKVIGDAEVITCRPADLLKPELEKYRSEIGEYITQEEDVLTYALFPQVATKFFKARQAKTIGLDNSVRDEKNNAMPV